MDGNDVTEQDALLGGTAPVVRYDTTAQQASAHEHHVCNRSRHEPQVESPGDSCPTASRDLPSLRSAASFRLLPVALLAALGIAATAATSVYAVATLLCRDATRCTAAESEAYAGAVALATGAANACGVLVLGPLERLSRRDLKLGLGAWVACRAMGVVTLSVGGVSLRVPSLRGLPANGDVIVYFRSAAVALSGRLFEGFASDNLLHFNLNAVYVRERERRHVPRLMGTSLALYMVGISVSPVVAALFDDFTASFALALGLFGFMAAYLVAYVRLENVAPSAPLFGVDPFASSGDRSQESMKEAPSENDDDGGDDDDRRGLLATVFSPILALRSTRGALLPGTSLLLYNSVQAYIIPALMVHTSLAFGFTGRQNSILLSGSSAASAAYISFALFAVPRLTGIGGCTKSPHGRSKTFDALFALTSLTLMCGSLVLMARAAEAWQVYPVAGMMALGMAAPSFVKSHAVAVFPARDRPAAIGGLAMMETVGSLVAPALLGSWQTVRPGNSVFLLASGFVGLSTVLFFGSALGH